MLASLNLNNSKTGKPLRPPVYFYGVYIANVTFITFLG